LDRYRLVGDIAVALPQQAGDGGRLATLLVSGEYDGDSAAVAAAAASRR
jgi:hypothetical protein